MEVSHVLCTTVACRQTHWQWLNFFLTVITLEGAAVAISLWFL